MSVPTMETDAAHVAELVATLRARGLWLELRGADGVTVGPPELLDPETVAALRAAKPVLLAWLAEPRTWRCIRCGRFAFPLPSVCYWCRKAAEVPRHA